LAKPSPWGTSTSYSLPASWRTLLWVNRDRGSPGSMSSHSAVPPGPDMSWILTCRPGVPRKSATTTFSSFYKSTPWAHEAPSVVSTGGVGIWSPHARRDARSCARTWCSTRVERGGRGRWPGVSLGTVERVDHEPNLNAAFPLRSALRCNKGNKPPLDILGPWTGAEDRERAGEGLWPACREPRLVVDHDRRERRSPYKWVLASPLPHSDLRPERAVLLAWGKP